MLMEKYTVNISSIGDTKLYLGTDIGKLDYVDGSYAWTISSDSYVKEYIRNIKKRMKDEKIKFNKKLSEIKYSPKNPFYAVGYIPELYTSSECTEDQVKFFHKKIGELCWII